MNFFLTVPHSVDALLSSFSNRYHRLVVQKCCDHIPTKSRGANGGNEFCLKVVNLAPPLQVQTFWPFSEPPLSKKGLKKQNLKVRKITVEHPLPTAARRFGSRARPAVY